MGAAERVSTIRQIVMRVGAYKYMCENHDVRRRAYDVGRASSTLGCTMEGLQSSPVITDEPSPEHIIGWLNERHCRWREHVAALGDNELLEPRCRPEGEKKETRWIIGDDWV